MVMGFIERVSERQVRRYVTKEADDKNCIYAASIEINDSEWN